MGKNIQICNQDHWHALRSKNVGSSETAALLRVEGFLTYFRLWQIKAGKLPPDDLSNNPRVICGQMLESGCAKVFKHFHNLTMRKVSRYILDDHVEGLGASLDYEVNIAGFGYVPLEIKMTDYARWKDHWDFEFETANVSKIHEAIQPPLNYSLQLQCQLAVTNKPFGFIGVIVDGNKPFLIRLSRHEKIIALIRARVTQFWTSIKANLEPEPGPDDLSALRQLYPDSDADSVVDMSTNQTVMEAVGDMIKFGEQRKKAERDEKQAKATILAHAKTASIVNLGKNGQLKLITTKPNDGQKITPEMVGTFVGGRAGSCRIKYIKPTVKSPTPHANNENIARVSHTLMSAPTA